MFYIDRDYFSNRPDLKACQMIQEQAIQEIIRLRDIEKDSWLSYYDSASKDEPTGKWTSEHILTALYNLFRGNCAFCGNQILTKHFINKEDKGDNLLNGTVEHIKPKGKTSAQAYLDDKKALLEFYKDRVYKWQNYSWACKTCNIAKGDSWPYLNPCDPEYSCSHLADSPILFDSNNGKFIINPKIEKNRKEEIEKLLSYIGDKSNINATKVAITRKGKWSNILNILIKIHSNLNKLNIKNLLEEEISSYKNQINIQINLIKALVINNRTTPVSFRSYIFLYIYCINQNTEHGPNQIPEDFASQLLSIIDEQLITALIFIAELNLSQTSDITH